MSGFAPWLYLQARLHNWHRVDEGLYRSAQMYGGRTAALLDSHGIRTVINLRGENPNSNWYLPERSSCESLGITYLDRSLHSRRLPEKQALADLLESFQTAEAPVLIKCSGGADRTGLAAGLYLLQKHGVSAIDAARRQLSVLPYLHLPKRYQHWIRRLPEFYVTENEGLPLDQWIQERYTTDGFADWLDARGLDGSWRRRSETGRGA